MDDRDARMLCRSVPRMARKTVVDEIFSWSTGIGVLVGLYVGHEHAPARVDPRACRSNAAKAIGECFNAAALDTAKPYLIGAGVGAVVGTLVAVLLSLLLKRHKRQTPKPKGRRPALQVAAGRWITARYVGACSNCAAPIQPGDRILHRPRVASCEACGSGAAHPRI